MPLPEPFYKHAGQTIYCGDCLRLPLADRAVDLVFTSPPYEDARTYGIGFKLKGQAWVDWAMPRFLECLRVCRGLVAWVVQGKPARRFQWSATPALLMADLHRAGVNLRNPPIFYRDGVPGSGGSDWLRSNYEWIICATHGGRLPWSDNTAMGHPPRWAPGGAMSYRVSDGTRRNQWGSKPSLANERPSHRVCARRNAAGEMEKHEYTSPAIANPGCVIRCNVGGGLMGDPFAHKSEAPFPEKLVEFFVRSFCPPGGIVADPMCGSGTTLAVAQKNGCRGWGMDIRESQCEFTAKRLAQEMFKWTDEEAKPCKT